MFHRLLTPDHSFAFAANRQNCVAPDRFRAMLAWLAHEGIDVISLDAAEARLAGGDRRRFVCLTFDDGYRDNHDVLLPIAEGHGVPVTVYVAPGLIDGTAPLWWYGLEQVVAREATVRLPLDIDAVLSARTRAEKETAFAVVAGFMLRADARQAACVASALASRYGVDFLVLARTHMMDWPMVRALAASQLVEIGAHSVTHPPLAQRDASEVLREMTGSRDRLVAETGRSVVHFAYPFGTAATAGPREAVLAHELGFRSAVTSRAGHLNSGGQPAPHAWPRIGIGPDDGPMQFRLKLAGASALRARLSPA